MRHWLLKSEPATFGIDDLAARPDATEPWDGIRNYQARNLLRDEMKAGDRAFFYHSACKVPGIVGTVEVVREAYPDRTALDPKSPYFDRRASEADPRWVCVDVALRERFAGTVSLAALRETSGLDELAVLRKGNRLSVTPVTADEWAILLTLGRSLGS